MATSSATEAQLEESQAQLESLEQQLVERVEAQSVVEQRLGVALSDAERWQRQCQEHEQHHSDELQKLQAKHAAAIAQLQAELHEGRRAQDEDQLQDKERLQQLSAMVKEYEGRMPVLEQQLQQQAESVEQWQSQCEELRERHSTELQTLEAKHEALLVQLQAELRERDRTPDPAVCGCFALHVVCACVSLCTRLHVCTFPFCGNIPVFTRSTSPL